MSYKKLLSLKDAKFPDKKVLIIGAGWMAERYCEALVQYGVRDVSVISRSKKSAAACCEKFKFKAYNGGYELCLPKLGVFDLVIVAVPIQELAQTASAVIENGNLNVLVEKPGSFYAEDLEQVKQKAKKNGSRVRIAYNRLMYPSYWRLKELIQQDGGITSCRYTFTELVWNIDFDKFRQETYERWGITNSLHLISMAHGLIGMPKEIFDYRQGSFPWHPSGSKFAGAGIADKGIPFSYHADWESAGRWGIEIMTPENAYRMVPLEEILCCKKETFTWEPVPVEVPFPSIKEGVAEEVAVMLNPSLEKDFPLVSLDEAGDFIKLAEKIFGYNKKNHASD